MFPGSKSRFRIGRATAVAAALIAMGCGRQPRGAGQPPASATACAQPGWTTPAPVRLSDGRTAYVETPQVVELGDGRVLLLGSPVFLYSPVGQGDVKRVALAGITLDPNGNGMPLDAPPGYAGGVFTPRAVADPADTRRGVQMVWPGRTADTSNLLDQAVGLWTARYEAGRWSPAMRIVTDSIDWHEQLTSSFVRRGDWAAVLSPLIMRRRASLLLQRSGQTWRADTAPFWGSGMSLGATRTALVASYIGADFRPELNGNSLWIVRSTDDGRTWSDVHPVFFARDGAAMESQIVTRGDSVWLLWLQRRQMNVASSAPDSLGLSISPDAGQTWHRQRSVAVGVNPSGLHVVSGHDGIPHATFRVRSGDSLAAMHAWWQPRDGLNVEQVPGPEAASLPVIGIVRDSLWLLWGRMELIGPNLRLPFLVRATKSLACARLPG